MHFLLGCVSHLDPPNVYTMFTPLDLRSLREMKVCVCVILYFTCILNHLLARQDWLSTDSYIERIAVVEMRENESVNYINYSLQTLKCIQNVGLARSLVEEVWLALRLDPSKVWVQSASFTSSPAPPVLITVISSVNEAHDHYPYNIARDRLHVNTRGKSGPRCRYIKTLANKRKIYIAR